MMVLFLAHGTTVNDATAYGVAYHVSAPDDGHWAEMFEPLSIVVRSASDMDFESHPDGIRISRGRLSSYQR